MTTAPWQSLKQMSVIFSYLVVFIVFIVVIALIAGIGVAFIGGMLALCFSYKCKKKKKKGNNNCASYEQTKMLEINGGLIAK